MNWRLKTTQHADFRPISITPDLIRIMERTVVRRFLPAFLSLPPNLSFTDQFAFRLTESPTAAMMCLLNTVTNLLSSNQPLTLCHRHIPGLQRCV